MANGQKSEEEDHCEAQDDGEEAHCEEALVRIAPGEQFVAAYNIATQIRT
jgi:hypothetical protein